MTLPTTTLNASDDDSDMFGPPRSSPLRHNRPRVPMISAKLRLREERKRILQLCAHKLEKIKDSEANLRRSVCINNTYSRLTDEVRREKQSRYLANLPKSETSKMDNIAQISSSSGNNCDVPATTVKPKRVSSATDADLETLDREINALDAAMPLVDPEITQGAEQLEKALVSRKRTRMEEDNDRLVREALSQFYLPSPRLLSGIDDCPLVAEKRPKTDIELDLNLDLNQNQREFEVIMETLRLGDSCGQAAMMSDNGVFHNLVVASLET
uniref:SERTA domain-containing protein n=1 Tax=Phlebotomus kandelakii TaxID=1109342 RepID=A0A6B2E621_9DIPT